MPPRFIVPSLLPAPSDPHAVALEQAGMLRKYFGGGHRPVPGIPNERQVRMPLFMHANILAGMTLPLYHYECVRFALSPVFEQWVMGKVESGDHLITGFGYFNRLIPRIKDGGGLAILDARNSHPSNFWSLIAEEHARWDCKLPPIWPRHHLRQQRSAAIADYVLAPSRFVADSFLDRGFSPEKVFRLPYPVDLTLFQPPKSPRPKDRPLTLVSSGLLTLRKGSPYLFEAFKLIRKEVPSARLKLISNMATNFRPVFERMGYQSLPVDWTDGMKHQQMVPWLQESDIFLLPTIEEGMVRSAAEALGCGLPVVTTRNAGVDDLIHEGVNGSVIPIRSPEAIARAVLEWWERIRTGGYDARECNIERDSLGMNAFSRKLIDILKALPGFHQRI